MYLENKKQETLAFIKKLESLSETERAFLEVYITNMCDELRTELGLSSSPISTLGISLDSTIELIRLPSAPSVQEGFYRFYRVLKESPLIVEVVSQNTETGDVMLEVQNPDNSSDHFATMSGGLFLQLFERVKS